MLICDPPYGIEYKATCRAPSPGPFRATRTPALRDLILEQWGDRPALVFGTWRIPRPTGTHTRLNSWGYEALSGWATCRSLEPSDQEIYVLGHGFSGPRTSNVISCAPVQSMAKNGRLHPHEKPVALLAADDLYGKRPPGVIADPTAC